jgi:hypothetical protein
MFVSLTQITCLETYRKLRMLSSIITITPERQDARLRWNMTAAVSIAGIMRPWF